MKTSQFKKIIKEAVREAVREELVDLFTSQKVEETPKTPMFEVSQTPTPTPSTREAYMSVLNETQRGMTGDDFRTITMNTGDIQQPLMVPPGLNTAGEGSSLPQGEVSMDQIMGILNK